MPSIKLARAEQFLAIKPYKFNESFDSPQLKYLYTSKDYQERKALAGCELDIDTIRDNYLKNKDLPKWENKVFGKRVFLICAGGLWLTVFLYGKTERVFDFLDYSVYVK